MCGILGALAINGAKGLSQEKALELNELLHHRGPDDNGLWQEGSLSLAMRRLSIVDITGGHQPMFDQDKRFVIVFNGEIYNHQDLRAQLEGQGVFFKTKSDTEVIIAAYKVWGKDALKRFNGIFAFILWDRQKQELFAARDRVGVKPLYYYHDDKGIILASELSVILHSGLCENQLDLNAIRDYLSYWYVCQPQSIIKGVAQIPPGHFLNFASGQLTIGKYWELPHQETPLSFAKAQEEVLALLEDSIRLRLQADVEVATFLSGGIDSGLVTALGKRTGKPLRSFAIGFAQGSYNELPQARASAAHIGVDLSTVQLDKLTAKMAFEAAYAFDEPMGNASYLPTYFLAKHVSGKVKVVLTGDGGDELFGGYPTYQAPYYQAMWQSLPGPVRALMAQGIRHLPVSHGRISLDYRLKQWLKGVDGDYRRAHYTWRQVAGKDLQMSLWQKKYHDRDYDPFCRIEACFDKAKGLSTINQLMAADMGSYLLNDHLVKIDRMGMAHGLEMREPFLDYRLVELVFSLPAEYKVSLFQTKRLLKSIASRYLPYGVVKGKKKGLTAPIASWIADDLKDCFNEHLRQGLVTVLFEKKFIEQLLAEHQQRCFDHSRVLWALWTLNVWGDRFKGLWRI